MKIKTHKYTVLTLFILMFFACDNQSQGLSVEQKRKINFELYDNRVVVQMIMNDSVPVKFMLDDGCKEILLTEAFYLKNKDRLGLKLMSDLKVDGGFVLNPEYNKSFAIGGVNITIGDTVLDCQNSYTFTTNNNTSVKNFVEIIGENTLIPKNIDGILPLRHLSKLGLIEVNFENNSINFPEYIDTTFVIYNTDKVNANNSPIIQYPLSIRCVDGKIFSEKFNSVLDLGSQRSLLMNKNNHKNFLNIIDKNTNIISKDNSIIVLKQAFIGNEKTTVNNLDISKVNIGGNLDLLIGIGILKNYKIIYDYHNKKIGLKPIKEEINAIETGTFLYGIYVYLSNGTRTVYGIEKGLNTRLRLGDKILNIGDIDGKNLSDDEFKELKKKPDTTFKTITVLRDGKKVVVNL